MENLPLSHTNTGTYARGVTSKCSLNAHTHTHTHTETYTLAADYSEKNGRTKG